ncbi:hypothetical protein V6N13_048721 [Hibiscus sabdariffa]
MPLMKLVNHYNHHMIGLWALLQQSPTSTKTNHVSNTECLSVTICSSCVRRFVKGSTMLSSMCTFHIPTSHQMRWKRSRVCLDLLMRSGFLCLCKASIVIQTEFYSICYAGDNP